MSRTVVTYPMIGALVAAEKFLGPNRVWCVVNPTQATFLPGFFIPGRPELPRLREIEGITYDSIASLIAAEINRWLAGHGFGIQLDDFAPDEFSTAAMLEVLVRWYIEGTRTTITRPNVERPFDAFRIGKGSVSFFQAKNYPDPIARLPTKSGVRVQLTPLDNPPEEDFDLVKLAMDLTRGLQPTSKFGGIRVPMVDLDQKVDISWLLGMRTEQWYISQAKQQTIFKMNEKGALAKSAVAIGARSAAPVPPDYIVDRPFLIWMEIGGLSQPLFTGWITEEDWKDPGPIPGLD